MAHLSGKRRWEHVGAFWVLVMLLDYQIHSCLRSRYQPHGIFCLGTGESQRAVRIAGGWPWKRVCGRSMSRSAGPEVPLVLPGLYPVCHHRKLHVPYFRPNGQKFTHFAALPFLPNLLHWASAGNTGWCLPQCSKTGPNPAGNAGKGGPTLP